MSTCVTFQWAVILEWQSLLGGQITVVGSFELFSASSLGSVSGDSKRYVLRLYLASGQPVPGSSTEAKEQSNSRTVGAFGEALLGSATLYL